MTNDHETQAETFARLDRTAEMARVMVTAVNQFRALGADDAHIIRFLRDVLEEMTGEEQP